MEYSNNICKFVIDRVSFTSHLQLIFNGSTYKLCMIIRWTVIITVLSIYNLPPCHHRFTSFTSTVTINSLFTSIHSLKDTVITKIRMSFSIPRWFFGPRSCLSLSKPKLRAVHYKRRGLFRLFNDPKIRKSRRFNRVDIYSITGERFNYTHYLLRRSRYKLYVN